METVLIEVSNNSDIGFIRQFATRLGLKSKVLTLEEKEDIALGRAIEEGRKGEYVDKETVIKALRK